MWKFEQQHLAQDIFEFEEIAQGLGWTAEHTARLKQYALNEKPGNDLEEQKHLCHEAGLLHPYEQNERSIQRWIKTLETPQ